MTVEPLQIRNVSNGITGCACLKFVVLQKITHLYTSEVRDRVWATSDYPLGGTANRGMLGGHRTTCPEGAENRAEGICIAAALLCIGARAVKDEKTNSDGAWVGCPSPGFGVVHGKQERL